MIESTVLCCGWICVVHPWTDGRGTHSANSWSTGSGREWMGVYEWRGYGAAPFGKMYWYMGVRKSS